MEPLWYFGVYNSACVFSAVRAQTQPMPNAISYAVLGYCVEQI